MWSWRRRILAIGPRIWAGLLVVILTAGLTCYVCVNYVVQRNKQVYGAGVISDIADGQLARAYTWWQSVEAGPRLRHIPVPLRCTRRGLSGAVRRPRNSSRSWRVQYRHWTQLGCESKPCDYTGAFYHLGHA